ncbi:notchless protein homolog 1-like isoform X1 [Dysidea avara]|uniref:notchless protein homolog 1-like isoform X1 n=1 Tax=Dysidea avara TaxID=196820 RepID=UPI0033225118
MMGHQQLINQVSFSPDARLIASASFDKSVKLWDGRTGKYITSLRGHVSAVYQISWSADSRLLCSGSSDSTLKVWDIKNRKLLMDLPGHVDEVFSVDWSTNGEQVASGGRDRHIKIITENQGDFLRLYTVLTYMDCTIQPYYRHLVKIEECLEVSSTLKSTPSRYIMER